MPPASTLLYACSGFAFLALPLSVRAELAEAPLAQSLASANREVAELRQANGLLRLQVESLGLAGLKPELRPLQERLIEALSDYRLAELRVKELSDRVVGLSEAALALLSSKDDASARDRLQLELASADHLLAAARAAASAAPVPIDSSKIISLKDDLGLAVINTGSESGLRLGTPMRVIRGDQTVATGLVVDVRGRISGVLLTSSETSSSLKIGDQVKPETISSLK